MDKLQVGNDAHAEPELKTKEGEGRGIHNEISKNLSPSMLGKRRRESTGTTASSSTPSFDIPSSGQSLTREALYILNTVCSPPSQINFPPPYQNMPRAQPSSPLTTHYVATIVSIWTNISNTKRVLTKFHIYMGECRPFPPSIQALVDKIKEPCAMDNDPNPEFVEKAWYKTKDMMTDASIHAIADHLIYRPKYYLGDINGEDLIACGRKGEWHDRVPVPRGRTRYMLEDAMEESHCPRNPQPDLSFGYSGDVFTWKQSIRLRLLDKVHILDREPWFPYLVVEWKGPYQAIAKAEFQAGRDTTAAIDTLYKLFRYVDPTTEPSPHLTCVFCLCVNYNLAYHWLHWRHTSEDGTVSYRAEDVQRAFLNDREGVQKIRGTLVNALEWVRGERLAAIRDALLKLDPNVGPFSGRSVSTYRVNMVTWFPYFNARIPMEMMNVWKTVGSDTQPQVEALRDAKDLT
ncbi:MAG: hypothetical protein Q9171_000452 [Xanthocarpia ochracea]